MMRDDTCCHLQGPPPTNNGEYGEQRRRQTDLDVYYAAVTVGTQGVMGGPPPSYAIQ